MSRNELRVKEAILSLGESSGGWPSPEPLVTLIAKILRSQMMKSKIKK